MKEKSEFEKRTAEKQVSLLTEALTSAVDAKGHWLNASGKLYPKLYPKGFSVSPFNALVLALDSDAKGCKSNLFTQFSEAKARGESVREHEKGVPFLYYNWNKYVNRNNPDDVITKEAYAELSEQDKQQYKGVKNREIRVLFNIDQTLLPMANETAYTTALKKDGTVVNVNVGEDENDPVVYITDLLIHLAGKQLQKKASEVIEGENLDILIGSRPLNEESDEKKKEAVKSNVLRILKEKYDVEEEDFLSAELEIVPAGKARDCGLDRSMVLAYGQDDRVCAFTSLFAMLDVEEVEHTACCILVDKEEIGSVGATGMHSRFFENTVAELVALTEGESDLKVRRALMNSRMLSSDVSAAYDPMYAEVFEKRSSAFFGKGLVFNKFTGARGKSGSNDANAEYLAKIRNAMDAQSVAYQFAELGKVDAGGGGTIAYIMANYGMEVIDSGVAVLSMHAPWEVTSKADVYEAYKGYKAFIEEMR